jgi:hypothetical protein
MPKRLALFIGNSTYDDPTLTRLKTPAADVRALASAFRDPAIGEFDEVEELIDQNEVTVRRAIASFFGRRHPEDMLVLYFSGHGVKDDLGRLYLAVRDTSYTQLSATGIASTFVVERMDECRSKRQILILDCCNAGAFARGSKGDPTTLTADTFAGNGFGRVVLTASDSAQYALEGDQVIERAQLSLFTHYLLEGMTTGAASNEDVITLDALYDYAYGRIVSSTPGQTPRKWVYNQQGLLQIARNPRRTGALPAALPHELRTRIQDPRAQVRLESLAELGRLVDSGDGSAVVAARAVLERLADSDRSKSVRAAARDALAARAARIVATPSPANPKVSNAGSAPTADTTATKQDQSPASKIADTLHRLPSSQQIADSLQKLPVASVLSKFSMRRGWTLAMAAAIGVAGLVNGGLLGFLLFLPTGRLMAGTVEGGLIATAAYLVLRHHSIPVDVRRLLLATIIADVVRWHIPLGNYPVQPPTFGAALVKGVLDGAVLGAAQAWALRLGGVTRSAWVLASVAGWAVALQWFSVATKLFSPQTMMTAPLIPSVVIGTVSGLLVGAVTALAVTMLRPLQPVGPAPVS